MGAGSCRCRRHDEETKPLTARYSCYVLGHICACDGKQCRSVAHAKLWYDLIRPIKQHDESCLHSLELFKEYNDRPVLPAPLIVFAHAWMALRWLISASCSCHSGQVEPFDEIQQELLRHFQERNTDKYHYFKACHQHLFAHSVFQCLIQSRWVVHVLMMCRFIDFFYAQREEVLDVKIQSLFSTMDLFNSRMDDVTEMMTVSRSNLHSVQNDVRMLMEQQPAAHGIKIGTSAGVAQAKWVPSAIYPGTQIERVPVAAHQVDWSVAWSEYKPPVYTALIDSGDHDVDVPPASIRYNTVEGTVDRKTSIQDADGRPLTIKVIDDLPRNPFGRTGLAGRGCLARWGVNWTCRCTSVSPCANYVLQVISWSRDGDGKTEL